MCAAVVSEARCTVVSYAGMKCERRSTWKLSICISKQKKGEKPVEMRSAGEE